MDEQNNSPNALEEQTDSPNPGLPQIPESPSSMSLSRSVTREDVTSLTALATPGAGCPERSQDLGRSQTVPRSFGRRALRTAETMDGRDRSIVFGGVGEEGARALEMSQLMKWCRSSTQGYEGVDIRDFSASWGDGLAVCALVHRHLPGAFPFSELRPTDPHGNWELAVRIAEQSWGCPRPRGRDPSCVTPDPDEGGVCAYLTELRRCLLRVPSLPGGSAP